MSSSASKHFRRRSPEELVERITEYLSMGGAFSPEMMEHDKVRDLLIDCRDALIARRGAKG